jgi:hypothetical protein
MDILNEDLLSKAIEATDRTIALRRYLAQMQESHRAAEERLRREIKESIEEAAAAVLRSQATRLMVIDTELLQEQPK